MHRDALLNFHGVVMCFTWTACKVDGDSGGSGDLFLYADSIKDTMPNSNWLNHSINRNDTIWVG